MGGPAGRMGAHVEASIGEVHIEPGEVRSVDVHVV
jgi:hypothetical protein